MILESAPGPLAQAVGWALLHLLWQGTAIAAMLALSLSLLSGRSANTRYVLSCVALALVVLTGVVTAFRSFPASAGDATPLALLHVTPSTFPPTAAGTVGPERVDRLAGLLRATNDALPLIVTLWLVGVALLSVRLIAQWRRARRLVTRGATPACEPWLSIGKRLSVALGVRRVVRLFESTAIIVPAAVGMLRPVILLPASAIAGLAPSQLEMILAHELAHVRRHDFLVNLLQSAVETLLFYHPAVWWISRQVRIERENCCDDLAVSVCGSPLQYARALTRLEELRAQELPLVMSANGGSLLERVRRIVRDSTASTGHARGAAAVALLSCMLLALAGPSLSSIGKRQSPVDLPRPLATKWDASATTPATEHAHGEPATPRGGKQATASAAATRPAAARPSEAPSAAASAAPQKARIKLTLDELIELHSQGMSPSQLLELRFLFPGISVQEATGLHNVGATPELIRELRAMGLEIDSPSEASGLAAVGVSPEFVREMRAAGLPVETAEDAQGLAAVGVSAEFVREMRAAGLPVETAEDAQGLAAVGVSAEFVREMRAAGLPVESAEDAQGLAAVGVSAEFVREMRAAGLPVESAEDAQGLAAVGVSPEYIRGIRAAGLRMDSVDHIQSLAAVGVTPEYVREMRKAGVDLRDAKDAQSLRVQNVTPEFVRRLARAGYRNLTIEQLCRLGVAGLSGDFIEEMARYRTK